MKLFRSFGVFTTQANSDVTVHFQKMQGDDFRGTTELYEVALFRRLRRAMAAGTITDLRSSGGSFYLLLASAVTRLFEENGNRFRKIVHLNESIGPLLEALRLLRQADGGDLIEYLAYIADWPHYRAFNYLNSIPDNNSGEISAHALPTNGRLGPVPVSGNSTVLIVLDLLKLSADRLTHILDRHFSEVKPPPALVVARVAKDHAVEVTDVIGNRYTMPSIVDLATWCVKKSLRCSYLLLEDFDRDFILPFEGRYGVGLFYFCHASENPFSSFGFQPLISSQEPSRNLPMVAETVDGMCNYDASFQTALPSLSDVSEPDWLAWKEARDWDTGARDWTGGANQWDGLIHVLRSSKRPDAIEAVEQIAGADAAHRQLSVYGLVVLASSPGTMRPNIRMDIALQAAHQCDGDVVIMEFLVRNLYVLGGATRPTTAAVPITVEVRTKELLGAFVDLGWIAEGSLDQVLTLAQDRLIDQPRLLDAILNTVRLGLIRDN